MSLTSFLENRDVKEKFRQEFLKPTLSRKANPLAAPLTKNYSLVGTAFDYLMRFYIERLNPQAITHRWITEASPGYLQNLLEYLKPQSFNNSRLAEIDLKSRFQIMPLITKKILSTILRSGIARTRKELVETCESLYINANDIVSKAKENHSVFLKTGKITDELMRSTLLLAQLEPIVRRGGVYLNLGVIDDRDVADLTNLIALVDSKTFRTDAAVLLNPGFGLGSAMVGGADADLVIDDMIIDIKTVKELALTGNYFNQLIGYYTLYKIDEIDDAPQHEIRRVGIYFSRYGYLHVMNIQDVIDISRFMQFLEWFKERARKEV